MRLSILREGFVRRSTRHFSLAAGVSYLVYPQNKAESAADHPLRVDISWRRASRNPVIPAEAGIQNVQVPTGPCALRINAVGPHAHFLARLNVDAVDG